jgi:hypothetical protein
VLAALIIADEEGADASVALLPILGQPLVELQARQAHAAGAGHIVICTRQVPAGLVAALDRLKSDGINAAIVRSAREAADSIHPDESVLLIGQGCAGSRPLIDRLAQCENTVVAVEELEPGSVQQELIDAHHAWAGFACIDGALVRKTATIPGDWALGPTLLRLALQAGAARLDVTSDPAFVVTHIRKRSDAEAAASAYLRADQPQHSAGLSAQLVRPIIKLGSSQLGRLNVHVPIFAIVPLMLAIVSLGLAGLGWTLTALLLFVFSMVPAGIAQSLTQATIQQSRALRWFWVMLPWVGRVIIFGFGWSAMRLGWGREAPILALWLIWMLWEGQGRRTALAPDEGSAALLCVAAGGFGFPLIGLAVAIGHCALGPIRGRFSAQSAI